MKEQMINTNRLETIAVFRNMMVHAYSVQGLLCSRLNKLYLVQDLHKPKPVEIARIPWGLLQQVARFRIVDRLLKYSILQVHETRKSEYIAGTGHQWWHIDSHRNVSLIQNFPSKRPMNRGICESESGVSYVAEYSSNPQRDPVRIFRSKSFREFEVAWEFPKQAIRHVHALIVDSTLKNRIWILTGDWDNESGIFYTDDEFASVHLFLMLGQKTRATDLKHRDGKLFWGMDSPSVTSLLYSCSATQPDTLEDILELPGPAYYMCENSAGGMYVGTTVEPGPGLKDNRGHIFGAKVDGTWEELASAKKDILPQNGIYYFPKGTLPANFLAYSQRALRPHEGSMTIVRDREFS